MTGSARKVIRALRKQSKELHNKAIIGTDNYITAIIDLQQQLADLEKQLADLQQQLARSGGEDKRNYILGYR